MSEAEKIIALCSATQGAKLLRLPKAKYRVGGSLIHVRFCAENKRSRTKYKFNLNPNTLSADYELWTCGNSQHYYLIPIPILREIYDDPNTYVDSAHPEIRVVSLDIKTNEVMYARGGKSTSITPYFRAVLPMHASGA